MKEGCNGEKPLNEMTFSELDATANGLVKSVLNGDPASVK